MPSTREATLLCMVGLSPAIITETLYGLARECPSVAVVHLRLVTTREGEVQLSRFLRPDRGGLWRFLRRFPELHPTLGVDGVRVDLLRGDSGLPLQDLETPVESRAVGDQLLALVGELSREDSPPLIGSIAGGRKTMSAYLTLAFCLRARPTDRLTHVLMKGVGDPDPALFLPSKKEAAEYRDNPSTCPVRLVDIPFPVVSPQISALCEAPTTLSEMVAAQRRDDALQRNPPVLRLDVEQERLIVGDAEVSLTPRQFQVYHRLIEPKLRCDCQGDGPRCPDHRCWLTFRGTGGERLDLVRCHLSRIKKAVERALGSPAAAVPYVYELVKGRQPRYGIPLHRRRVRVEGGR